MKSSKETAEQNDANTKIVVMDRGWVYVGQVTIQGDMLTITNAKNIRRWGTTRGLGQLAENGPTQSTVMDDSGTVIAPIKSVIHMIECKHSW